MRDFKKVSALLAVLFFAFALSGCGVSKDEHAKIVEELKKVKAELAEAEKKVVEISGAGELNTRLADKLRVAEEQAKELGDKLEIIAGEKSELLEKLGNMQAMLDELQAKLKSFQGKSGGLPMDLLKKR